MAYFANPGDAKTLKPHLRRQARRLGKEPEAVITDAGYGSEENPACLENRGAAAVVKYSTRRKEQGRKRREDKFRTENWEYDRKGKYYVCPNGKKVTYRETKKEKAGGGCATTADRYECESRGYCRMKKQCAAGPGTGARGGTSGCCG